ncbi:MAG: hypothetical protein P4M15_02070, partial [Alphaproteobacteria bacterium]|nr:hypothetical protein [Alphaproteobacteria bacterium]
DPHFWWMSAMAGLWLVFMAIVFGVEPLLHEQFEKMARSAPFDTLRRIAIAHGLLLALAAVTVFGAVTGAHGMG